ncbi:LacI family DNA-binding transcriptional regulator [Pseudooceanicola algae]|uniref:Putative HTH-type transcriptional repressor ExuR n=1 Tax=Pseudooceanicola algae TaxID=1537215 RepID=A0A418SEQ8_9RHOB|nr:substrate-binding domain-containing protein [Pseudooceanicola algae]QPM89719.1 putative HTH-type transcriptional repressor ExuR [Pseudooceanicola algae]
MNLKSLAEALGLSQTTVSRALNGYPEVSEATRQRVMEAARQHSYTPNSRAKGLATGRTMMIGQVIPTTLRHEMVNPIFGDFVAGASQTLAEFGYDMVFTRVPDDDESRIYREYHARRVVDGVILQGPAISDTRIPHLNGIGLPFVVHGRSSGVDEPYSWVDVNNRRSFQRATQFLIDLGHRRIALLNGLEHMDFAFRRRQGYLDAHADSAIPCDPALMCSEEMTEEYGYRLTAGLLRTDQPPTAVLCASMIAAIGVRRAIEEAGLAMGRDVSVITHDDDLSYLRNGGDVPIFTATRSSVRQAGEILARQLVAQISDPQNAPRQTMMEAELVVGRSTGPVPRPDATTGAG